MNFLGHIFLSGTDKTLMLNNLFGDFVKGSDLSEYPTEVITGIKLYRHIDFYIDNHKEVLDLKHLLQKDLPKIAGVAIDLYFDHLLAINWEKFHSINLRTFTEDFYLSFNLNAEIYNERFILVMNKMAEKNWLWQYQNLSGLHKACTGVSHRLSFPNELIHGVDVYRKFESEITSTFYNYMKDAIKEFGIK